MKIVRLQTNDDEQLTALFKAFHFKNHELNNTNFLANPYNYLFVAYESSEPVGYLFGYELERPETKRPIFFIYDIEVRETQRRKGIATALIEAFMRVCKEKNGSEIFVLTNAANSPALNLYRKTGGVRENEDDVMFVYNITQTGS